MKKIKSIENHHHRSLPPMDPSSWLPPSLHLAVAVLLGASSRHLRRWRRRSKQIRRRRHRSGNRRQSEKLPRSFVKIRWRLLKRASELQDYVFHAKRGFRHWLVWRGRYESRFVAGKSPIRLSGLLSKTCFPNPKTYFYCFVNMIKRVLKLVKHELTIKLSEQDLG